MAQAPNSQGLPQGFKDRIREGRLDQVTVLHRGSRVLRSYSLRILFGLLAIWSAFAVDGLEQRVAANLSGVPEIDQEVMLQAVDQVGQLASLILMAAGLAFLTSAMFSWYSTEYVIDEEQIHVVRGIFNRKMDTYFMYEIGQVEYRQGPFESITNSATIVLRTERTKSRLIFNFTPIPVVVKLKGLGSARRTQLLYHQVRDLSLGQQVEMRGNLIRPGS